MDSDTRSLGIAGSIPFRGDVQARLPSSDLKRSVSLLYSSPVERVAALYIKLLGDLHITRDGETITSVNTNRLRTLLAYLVLHAGAPQSREYVAFLLWPDSDEAQARTNLRQLLHHLRKAVPDSAELITADAQTLCWTPGPDSGVDVLDFRSAIARAAESAARSDRTAERTALENAIAIYGGDLVPDLYDEWVQPLREELKQQLVAALGRLGELLEQAAEYAAGIGVIERLVAEDPVRELSYRQLMRLHLAVGDRAAAVRVYHRGLKVLRRELGISPAAETRALLDTALLSQELTSSAPDPPRLPVASSLPLVGRDREWTNLRAAWAAVEQGQSLLTLIRGEPGIGKSRLAEELFAHAFRQATAVRTRCYSAHGNLSYAPVCELLRTEQLRSGIERLRGPQLTELARVLPELLLEERGIAAPQPLAESWQRQHFFEALMAAFRAVRRPLLLLIDDLQWCDRETLEWLHLLLRSGQPGALMVLGTVRSDEVDRDHPLLNLARAMGETGRLLEMDLGPLAPAATESLARQIADANLDDVYLERLYAETRGNPLFVIESVRSGIEDPATSPSAASLVNAVITARLARLSPPAYEVAGLAAAVGRSFSFDLLLECGDRDEDSLAAALDELWRRRIIVGLEGQTYDFSHDRLREVAYAELSPVRRRHLHRRLARALKTLHGADPPSVAGRIAGHFEQAGLAGEAIPYYSVAAQAAKQVYADAEASALLERALRLCRDLPAGDDRDRLELDILARLQAVQFSTLGYAAAEVGETNARALVLAQRLGDRRQILDALGGGWLFHIVRGQLETAKHKSSQFLAIAEQEPTLAPVGHFLQGVALFHLGHVGLGREHLERALARDGENRDTLMPVFFTPFIAVFIRSYLSHILLHQGAIDQALRVSDEAMNRARELADPFSLAIASTYAAMLDLMAANPAAAESRAAEAVSLCRQYDFSYYFVYANVVRAAARAHLTPDPATLEEFRAAVDAFRATGSELRLPYYYALLADAYRLRRLYAEGLASVAAGLACESRNGETWCAALLRCIRGDLLLASHQREGALTCYRAALEIARAQGAKAFELRAAASAG